MLVAGVGLGVVLVSVAVSVLSGAADEESGMLSGLNTTGHEIGGSLGIAVLLAVATSAAGGGEARRSGRHRRRVPRGRRDRGGGEPRGLRAPAPRPQLPAPHAAHAAGRRPLAPDARSARRRRARRAPADAPRADAERNVERIVDAAVDALGDDDEVSMAAIAARAGVARATLYAHFPTREALLEAVTRQAFAQVTAVIAASEPDRGEPAAALARVIGATWRTLGRYHALIGDQRRPGPRRPARAPRVGPRGARAALPARTGGRRVPGRGARRLAPLDVMALVHAASGELRAGRLPEADAEAIVVGTVLGAVGGERPRP